MTLEEFVHTTASESPAPGGGSISAAMGAMGAALATMVANLSSHKRGWNDRWEELSNWADKGKTYHDELLRLIDDDTDAFNKIMEAFGLPKGTDRERSERDRIIQEATRRAIEVPLQAMKKAYNSMKVIKAMDEIGLWWPFADRAASSSSGSSTKKRRPSVVTSVSLDGFSAASPSGGGSPGSQARRGAGQRRDRQG